MGKGKKGYVRVGIRKRVLVGAVPPTITTSINVCRQDLFFDIVTRRKRKRRWVKSKDTSPVLPSSEGER